MEGGHGDAAEQSKGSGGGGVDGNHDSGRVQQCRAAPDIAAEWRDDTPGTRVCDGNGKRHAAQPDLS